MAKFQSHAQYQTNFMWSVVSPLIAMIVAIPLSVALVTNIINKQFAAQVDSLRQTTATQMAPAAAYQTASASQNGCVGTAVAQATPATTTPPVVQTASVSMPSKTWANPIHSNYAKSYTHISNSYTNTNTHTNTSTKTYIVDSYNNNSKNYNKTKNVNSNNSTSTTVNSTTTNTASGGSVINSSTSANTVAVNGDKNHTGVYNNQSSTATNTTTTVGSNNGNNSHNNNGSYNHVDSHDKTKVDVDVDVDSHDKTGTFNSNNGNFSNNLSNNKVKVD